MAVDLTLKKSNYIVRYIDKVTTLLNNLKELKELRTEWDSEGYSSLITDYDFNGATVHLDAASLTAAVTSIQAVIDLLAANGNAHNSNLYKLVR